MNDCVKSDIQKWIISHLHVIQSTITNDKIKVKLDIGNWGTKTGIHQKIILKVPVLELHIQMLNKYYTGFYMAHVENELYILVIPTFDYFIHHN